MCVSPTYLSSYMCEPHPLAAGYVLLQAGVPMLVVLVQTPLTVAAVLMAVVVIIFKFKSVHPFTV